MTEATAEPAGPVPAPPWAVLRRPEQGVLGGLLAGLGWRLGVDPVLVRIAFALLTVFSGGFGIVLYALGWVLVPTEREGWDPRLARVWSGRGRSAFAVGVALLLLALLLGLRELGIWWGDAVAWPIVLAGFGVALLWRGGKPQEGVDRDPRRSWWRTEPEGEAGDRTPDGRADGERARDTGLAELYRGGFGVALVLGAVLLFLTTNDVTGPARDFALTALAVLVALGLIAAPFLWRLGRRLAAERAARIRTQEKAEVSAHLHDSVLQTLTLLRKHADRPDQVELLAARQERELRRWLEDRDGQAEGGERLVATLRRTLESVEDSHGVRIDLVAVGDRDLDEDLGALVAAAGEAATNAAKFGAEPISVFLEATDEAVEAFVRDRGAGFDPAAIPSDRRGVRDSIQGRIHRHGGEAQIRSSSGGGTEVRLRLPREGPR